MQQDIDLKNDIEVFIGNDGSDVKLSIEFLQTYPFPIQYHYFEHGHLAATRAKLFDLVTAPWVMWCDADDKFISTIALSMIFIKCENDVDAIICDFVGERLTGEKYVPYHDESVHVHGKVYRTEFLRENHIEWHPELHEHQDSAFNVLARNCAKKVITISAPLYMWCYNPNSISHKNGKYHLPNTWPAMIDSYDALIEDLKARGMGPQSCYYAKYCIYASYYELCQSIWQQEDVAERKFKAYKRLSEFYLKHFLLIKNCTEEYTKKAREATHKVAVRKHKQVDNITPFTEWFDNFIHFVQLMAAE